MWLGVLLASAPASAVPATCADLEDTPEVSALADQVRGRLGTVVDLSRHRLLGPIRDADLASEAIAEFRSQSKTLTIVAIDLPHGAPLVEMTCALGRALDLSISQTVVVVSSVGLHAYSGGLSYHQIRVLARRHNAELRRAPVRESASFALAILSETEDSERIRDRLGAVGLVLLVAGALSLAWLLRRRSAQEIK